MSVPLEVSLSLTSCEIHGVSEMAPHFMNVRLRVQVAAQSAFLVGVSGGVPGSFSYTYEGRLEGEAVSMGTVAGDVREVIEVGPGSRAELVFELALPRWLLDQGGDVELSFPEWGRATQRQGIVVLTGCRGI